MYCSIYEAKTNALIRCVDTVQFIYAFIFAYAKAGFLIMRAICSYDIEEFIVVYMPTCELH